MQIGIRSIIKKISYAFLANIISTMVNLLVTLFLPKFLGNDVTSYGYYQLYIFYITYVGFFHFGWCDGLLLSEGGKEYKELCNDIYTFQFWGLFTMDLLISLLIAIIGIIFIPQAQSFFIILMVACNVLLLCTRQFLCVILQAVNRIGAYSLVTVIGRTFYGIYVVLVFIAGIKDFRLFIIGDVVAKCISLLVGCYFCKDIVFKIPRRWKEGFKEAGRNISAGISLLAANLANHLIVGIVRIGIQYKWDVATYGKVSFTLTVSNMFQLFIGAVAVVLYPTLRRVNKERLPEMYGVLRDMLMIPAFLLLVLYYPIQRILIIWLPQYADGLAFMGILFPLCVYTAKQQMIVQTYMQVFRLEKDIMKANIMGVIVAVLSTFISVIIFENLVSAMFAMIINQVFRCVYAEVVLNRTIKVKVNSDILLELLLTAVFIISSWFIGDWIGVVVYVIGCLAYLFIKRKSLKNVKDKMLNVIKGRGEEA